MYSFMFLLQKYLLFDNAFNFREMVLIVHGFPNMISALRVRHTI